MCQSRVLQLCCQGFRSLAGSKLSLVTCLWKLLAPQGVLPVGLFLVPPWGQTAAGYQQFGKTSEYEKEGIWGRICNREENVNILS